LKNKNIYNFIVRTIDGDEISLEKYKGKVLLISNTASHCGFTPQLKSLEKLQQQYRDSGFEVLAFPSNDFSNQEPLKGKAIQEFCEQNFQSTFSIFNKIHVKGINADPLFQFLAAKKFFGISTSRPRWNFYKYLINREGEFVDFFITPTSPDANRVHRAIEQFL
jgi:glutathione peroxidase